MTTTSESYAPTVAQASCVFCRRIRAGEYDDGDVWAVTFEPLNPVTPGHRLVVPRIHTPDAITTPHLTGRVMEYAAKVAERRSCNLITSVGPAATQTVMHLHVHIVPRREGDGLALPWTGQQSSTGPDHLSDNDESRGHESVR